MTLKGVLELDFTSYDDGWALTNSGALIIQQMVEFIATIRKEIIIEVSLEQVWDAVRDVGAVHRRFVPGYTVDTKLDGDNRILTFASGSVARELIVSIDDEAYRLAYAVIEGAMPLKHHHASFQVFAESDQSSRLVWTTDFLPDVLFEEVKAHIDGGARVIKRTIETEFKKD